MLIMQSTQYILTLRQGRNKADNGRIWAGKRPSKANSAAERRDQRERKARIVNKPRRKALADIAERIESLREELETLRDEEQEYLDNMPENFQGSERYEQAEAAVDALDSALGSLEEAKESIEEASE